MVVIEQGVKDGNEEHALVVHKAEEIVNMLTGQVEQVNLKRSAEDNQISPTAKRRKFHERDLLGFLSLRRRAEEELEELVRQDATKRNAWGINQNVYIVETLVAAEYVQIEVEKKLVLVEERGNEQVYTYRFKRNCAKRDLFMGENSRLVCEGRGGLPNSSYQKPK